MRYTVDELRRDELLGTATDELVQHVAERHWVSPIELDVAGVTQEDEEASIPRERLRDRWLLSGDEPQTVPGHAVRFYIPFSGDPKLFLLRPNISSSNPPHGTVQGNELVFTFQSREIGPRVEQEYEGALQSVANYVRNQLPLVTAHNNLVTASAKKLLAERIERIKRAETGAAALGLPRRRPGAPTTYAAPEVRRQVASTRPSPRTTSTPTTTMEPTLPDAEYAHILKVMSNMALVLERSPSAFEAIGEEGIRWHFIVQLNGQYEGQATGETFNSNGKTDILVRSGDRNIFVAECKFWKGAKSFVATVDQLLGYLTWRDTKAAIVVFNREVQFSTVLVAIPAALAGHECCSAPVKTEHETTFSTELSRRDDPERKIRLTVLVFDVPKRTS